MKEVTRLSRRERQIMDTLYTIGEGSVADVRAAMADAPAYSSVRTFLTKLHDKGWVTYRQEGQKYVYRPAHERAQAARQAVHRLVNTFFGGSSSDAVVGLLGEQGEDLTADDINEIEAALAELKARRRRRRRSR